jgi:hypothetical protein
LMVCATPLLVRACGKISEKSGGPYSGCGPSPFAGSSLRAKVACVRGARGFAGMDAGENDRRLSGIGRRSDPRVCYGARVNHGTPRCISISGSSIDAAISKVVLGVLKPLGIDAAVKAIEAQTSETTAAQRQLELSLQQARYEAAHARRQYDAVDPANRLVAGELERRWNDALQAVNRVEGEIAAIIARGRRRWASRSGSS